MTLNDCIILSYLNSHNLEKGNGNMTEIQTKNHNKNSQGLLHNIQKQNCGSTTWRAKKAGRSVDLSAGIFNNKTKTETNEHNGQENKNTRTQ